MRTIRPAALLGAACLALAACSGTATVERSSIESKVKSAIENQVQAGMDSVSCPDELQAKKDATTRCVVTAGPIKIGATVTVTSVTDGKANFDVKVDDEPIGGMPSGEAGDMSGATGSSGDMTTEATTTVAP